MNAWRVAAAALLALTALARPGHAAADSAETPGQAIYQHGVLGSGALLEGVRESGAVTTGAAAACVNCHQRSGLGSAEGSVSIPPITGEYLFHPRAHTGQESVLPYVESMHSNRDPYTDTTLARAIREGLDVQGRQLSYLMPRFALNETDMAGLIAYLRKLTVRREAGVTDTLLHFATIFTPDADPAKRGAVLSVLQQYVIEKNRFPLKPSPRMWTSGKTAYSKSMYMANRHWELHVWDLTGPASTWQSQLEKHLTEEPVFAVLSGLGGSNWAPVQEFCERSGLPCLFPNVEVPVDSEQDFYSLFFSRGVLLEAGLIGHAILEPGGHSSITHVDQIYRAEDSGQRAAHALGAQLKSNGIRVDEHILAAKGHGQAVVATVRDIAKTLGPDHALVLWLRTEDIAALGPPPPGAAQIYMSGLLGGLEDAPLPGPWREHTQLTFPFDLPDKRGIRLDYPLGWFSLRQIPIIDLHLQADTYLACSVVGDAINHMADNVVRPYVIEKLQTMVEHRLITGYYPHLTLATNQHFASRGGYLAHFKDATGKSLVADSDWLVP
jgi:hypothetical protein